MHVPVLVTTIAIALGSALVCGYLATRLKLSPIVGYLLAGIMVGPHTPGLVADPAIAMELAEIGVVLLMFGVGLHFSPAELASVRAIAVPGALLQSLAATGLGIAAGVAVGWGAGGGLVLGLAVSVASTVVLVRGLTDNALLESAGGKTAIGWLIVEDLLTVIILIVLPAFAGGADGHAAEGGPWLGLAATLAKVGLMVAVVLLVGRRVVPWLLDRVARTRSRELFTLSVLGVALGIACLAAWGAGVSLALGAFLAGMAVGQSDLSHQAAADSIPLRDAFAVLFFVSVGMLFDPALLLERPGLVAATLGIILIAKPAVALALVLVLGHPLRSALVIAMGLAQVGEFSFIMARLGQDLDLLPADGNDVVLAGAIVSIALNPFLFKLIGPIEKRAHAMPRVAALLDRLERDRGAEPVEHAPPAAGHVILCGSGRVGTVVFRALVARGWPVTVIEADRQRARKLRERGLRVVDGDAGSALVLEKAGVASASLLVLAFADALTARLAVDHARDLNPTLPVVARVHSRRERNRFRKLADVMPVMEEFEAAVEITRQALLVRDVPEDEIATALDALRGADRGD